MKLRMVQWIDNVNHTAVSEEEIRKLGDTMKDLLSTIFDDKMQATDVIPLWKMERVPTDWKMTARTNIESDVFMMMSMLFFEGTVDFQCPILNAAPLRHVARVKIAGSLLLSDLNKQRSTVLEEVSNFKDKRRSIAKQVSIRRLKIR
ncbi:uncharacterized protein LOC130826027 [Amaranthus tricolor]|uniref:uncharacterized protein LOC130802354 n=1 Tax=Amaranthus tricolor TaxID=29722 RepID=UPI00258E4649|nr:uncharacterized protein LOC130802354 [Amaranthus tricolor]XP_057540560.1 uncharacterized protein LOC130818408 [Amaranthus tricolor]XP_057547482.1 uncharacterized protein LOC130826027 [Amaranthus tricolor]